MDHDYSGYIAQRKMCELKIEQNNCLEEEKERIKKISTCQHECKLKTLQIYFEKSFLTQDQLMPLQLKINLFSAQCQNRLLSISRSMYLFVYL